MMNKKSIFTVKNLLKAIEKSKCPMNPDMCHIDELKEQLGIK